MRSANPKQSPLEPANDRGEQRLPCAGQSYLERLGIVYLEQIRLTIVTELYMREMGIRQFYETIGGSSYDSVRRHFLKLAEYGWLRKVRTAAVGRGRPEALYRSTELAVIDTETWRTIPLSIRDAFTVQLLEEMGCRLAEALDPTSDDLRPDSAATFRTIEVDELAWCTAHSAIERCFQTLLQEQIDAKIRLENSVEEPKLVVVNLAAFEAPGALYGAKLAPLPKAGEMVSSPRWPDRVGKVLADRLDLRIIEELNRATMTPAQLHTAVGGTSKQGFLRRCKRLEQLGWTVNTGTETGGALHGASVYQFRAAAPNVSASDIYDRVPAAARSGRAWEAFRPFISTSIAAVEAGAFNSRLDRHLTMSPMLLDEIGRAQVAEALHSFEETLAHLKPGVAARGGGGTLKPFLAAFLLLGFQTPVRKIAH